MKKNKIVTKLEGTRDSAFSRFPILFTLLGTFGFVATLYGFEGIIDTTFFSDHPFLLLVTGLLILALTGSLYKKLD